MMKKRTRWKDDTLMAFRMVEGTKRQRMHVVPRNWKRQEETFFPRAWSAILNLSLPELWGNTFVLFWVICYSLSSKLILKFREGDIWTAVKDQWASSRRERKDVPAKGTSTSSNVWSSKKLFSARKQCVSQVACRLAVFQGNKRQSSGAVPRTLWSRKGNLLVSALITSMMRPILGPCFPLLHHTWTSGVSCGFAPCISFPTEIKRKAHKYLLQEGMKDLKQR